MTPEQHIAALQRIIVDTARYGGPEARAAIGMSMLGTGTGDMPIGVFFGPEWPPPTSDAEDDMFNAVGAVLNRSEWKGVEGGRASIETYHIFPPTPLTSGSYAIEPGGQVKNVNTGEVIGRLERDQE